MQLLYIPRETRKSNVLSECKGRPAILSTCSTVSTLDVRSIVLGFNPIVQNEKHLIEKRQAYTFTFESIPLIDMLNDEDPVLKQSILGREITLDPDCWVLKQVVE